MRTFQILAILVVGLSALVLFVRGQGTTHSAAMPVVMLGDVPRVLAALSSTGEDGHFAVLLFGTAGQLPAAMDAFNIQFSIEDGRTGIDWVLLAPLNVESQSRFVSFFERKGRPVLRREGNQVRYLRVEGEHLAELMQEFLRAEFKVTPVQKMNLIAEGFAWAG